MYIGDYIGAFNKARADEECQAAAGGVCQVQVPERASGLSTNERPLSQAITSLSYLTHVHNHREHWNGSPDIRWLKKGRARSRGSDYFITLLIFERKVRSILKHSLKKLMCLRVEGKEPVEREKLKLQEKGGNR